MKVARQALLIVLRLALCFGVVVQLTEHKRLPDRVTMQHRSVAPEQFVCGVYAVVRARPGEPRRVRAREKGRTDASP